MPIQIVFYAIIGVLLLSIAFVTVNLVYHIKITSRLNNLEKEVEKKTHEFDLLKKERSPGHAAPPADEPLDMHTKIFEAPIIHETTPSAEEPPIGEDSIQIVRNVGGTFETTDTVIHGHGYEQPSAPVEAEVRPEAAPAAPKPAIRVPFAPAVAREPVMARQPAARPSGTVIPLFSPAVRGPDFTTLYNALVEAMKDRANAAVSFDLSGIDALNDGELDYLEKLCVSLVNQRRPPTLVHCSGNLAGAIRRRPNIAPLVR
jgi:hypothetical protein